MGSRKAGSKPGKGGTKQPEAGKAGRPLTHDDFMGAATRVDPELRRRSDLLWQERTPGGRGPKASLTPEEVVAAAIEIADADGLGAVTMHAVAARLGFTTMALYRYFPSKEALYDAILDAGLGLPPEPPDPPLGWRDEIIRWAHAKRAMLSAKPWIGELPFVAAPHGPNWMAWLEALTRPLSGLGLAPAEIGQMISVIDGYTRGASDTSIALARARARGTSDREWAAAVGADLGRAIGDPRFPAFAAILTAPSDGRPLTMKEGFEFGLQRVLDGVQMYVTAARPTAPTHNYLP